MAGIERAPDHVPAMTSACANMGPSERRLTDQCTAAVIEHEATHAVCEQHHVPDCVASQALFNAVRKRASATPVAGRSRDPAGRPRHCHGSGKLKTRGANLVRAGSAAKQAARSAVSSRPARS